MGWVLAQEGHYGKGLVELREGIAASTAAGSLDNDYRLCVLAEACGKCGRVAEGLSLLEEAFEIVAASGTKHRVPELLRIKGELLLRLDSPDQSPEGCFHEALRLAGDQGAKSLELKAAISLARLYRSEGQDRTARDVLVPAYTWFTEGHETSDLAEAKELLDQLR